MDQQFLPSCTTGLLALPSDLKTHVGSFLPDTKTFESSRSTNGAYGVVLCHRYGGTLLRCSTMEFTGLLSLRVEHHLRVIGFLHDLELLECQSGVVEVAPLSRGLRVLLHGRDPFVDNLPTPFKHVGSVSRGGLKDSVCAIEPALLPCLDIGIVTKNDDMNATRTAVDITETQPRLSSSHSTTFCNSSTPILHAPAAARSGKFTHRFCVDLTSDLASVLGDTLGRMYSDAQAYVDAEWALVESLIFQKFRESTEYDCFWSWRDPRGTPVARGKGKQWNQATTFPPVPPIKAPNA